MNSKKIVIFNGSPRTKGTSFSFARTIKNLTEEKGSKAEIIHIIEYIDGKKDLQSLKQILSESEILGLVTPLYVDTLPYPVIWFFEKLARDLKAVLRDKSFFAIAQSAFPDVALCEPLIGMCRCFAESTGLKWMGGLTYAGGVMLGGANLEDLGKKGEKITYAFDLALEDILQNKAISSNVQNKLSKGIPKFLYRPFAAAMNFRNKQFAKKLGVTDLGRKVYLE